MRPEILNPLFTEVEALKGVGPQLSKQLKKLGISRVVDLLYHLPTGAIERINVPSADASVLGRTVIIELTPFDTRESRSGRGPTRIFASDADGNAISLVYFNNPGWAKRTLPLGQKRIVSGKLEQYGDEWQIIHPEVAEPGKGPPPLIREPVYPLTEGLTNRRLGELVREALDRAPELPEWIEPSLAARECWSGWRASLALLHREPGAEDARRRLAYDEIFANQLALLL
ncbi:MAG TPA: ATP-dependent DNA helicase RecG, partial [Sphingomicrobium sp.]